MHLSFLFYTFYFLLLLHCLHGLLLFYRLTSLCWYLCLLVWGPEFFNAPSIPVLPYLWTCKLYLDTSRSTDKRASDHALTICDRHNVLQDTEAGACVNL